MIKNSKPYILVFAVVFTNTQLWSQISITNNNMPNGGDTFRFSIGLIDTTVLQTFSDTGSNLTWDYSNLTPQRQGVAEFFNSTNTPYSGDVKNRLGEKLADTLNIESFSLYDVYEFYKKDSSQYLRDYRGASVPTGIPFIPTLRFSPQFKDADKVYQFPLNYENQDSSSFDFEFSNTFPPAYYSSKGTRLNWVDAWGSITTPFGTFECIRVRTDIIATDTVSFAGNNVGIESHTREYKWLTDSINYPVFILSGQVIDSIFIPTNAQYRDSVRDVPGLFAPVALFRVSSRRIPLNRELTVYNESISVLSASYEWSITPNTFSYVKGTSATSSDSVVIQFADSGLYDVQLIARNSDGIDTLRLNNFIIVEGPTSLLELNPAGVNALLASPNPVKSRTLFKIDWDKGLKPDLVSFYNRHGSLVYESTDIQLDGNKLWLVAPASAGHYTVRIMADGEFISSKILVIR